MVPPPRGLGARLSALLARRQGNRQLGVAVLAAASILIAVAAAQTSGFRLIDNRVFDLISTMAPPAPDPRGPVIVAIDEPSFSELGMRWPWPRSVHARLVEALRTAGAAAIGLDIIFAEPSSPEADAALAAVLGPDVVLAADEALIETPQASQIVRTEPLAEFHDAGARAGIASIALDADATFRRLPLYTDGFARELLLAAGADAPLPSSDTLFQSYGPARTLPTVSYYQALDPENFLPPDFLRGRIAVVGLSTQSAPTVDAGGADMHATPHTVRSGRLTPGAEIQATILDNLARGLSIDRAPGWLLLPTCAFGALLGALLVLRQTSWRTVALGGVALAGMIGAGAAMLQFGRVFVPPAAPVLAFLVVAVGQGARDYAAERRMRAGITRAFSQYLSPVLVERLASRPDLLELGGERRILTVLFCDVRGFTTIAEKLKDDPQRLTSLMNRLITPLSQAVLDQGGTIDKYIGDCVMAFWNAPLDEPDHAFRGVRAALAMLDAVDRLNEEIAAETAGTGDGPVRLRVGIGVNTGDCVVGNIGSDMRFAYSALGDPVNLASRLEGESKSARVPIMLGPETARLVGDRLPVLPLAPVRIRGKDEFVRPSTVLRGAAPDAPALAAHAALLADFERSAVEAAASARERLRGRIAEMEAYYDGLMEQAGDRRS